MIDVKKQKQYFDRKKSRYPIDLLLNKQEISNSEINQIIKLSDLSKKKKIADFGSGNGRITLPLLSRGFNVTAIDISPKSLDELRDVYHKNRQPSWGKLSTASGIRRNMIFDIIIGADILHHVDIPITLESLKNNLSKNGVMVFSEPNGWYLLWYFYLLWQKIPIHIEKNIFFSNPYYYYKTGRNLLLITKIVGLNLFPPQITKRLKMLNKLSDIILPTPIKTLFSYRLIIKFSSPIA